MNQDKPASEQFDLDMGMEFNVEAEDIESLAAELERVEAYDTEVEDSKQLSKYVESLKRLEDAAETARKEVFESELEDRVEVGERVGNLKMTQGTNTWVDDTEAAFAAVAEQGEDPLDVAKISISSLRDVLGENADEYIESSSYEYFRRQ